MECYCQTSLDEYYTLDEHVEENVEVGEETVGEADAKPSKCNYCILKDVKKYIFHPGAVSLYVKDGKLKVLADIDHVYHKCREGLIDNIGFLYRMMCELKSKGYNVVVVGKAFDDDLYVYASDRPSEDKIFYRGFTLKVLNNLKSIEGFEKMNWYMQSVDDETVREAVNIVEKMLSCRGLA
jgi:hypothetical protein